MLKGIISGLSDFRAQCYMYCLWEQFGLVDDKRELSLNGMLTFFQRIPAYRAEVEKAISECKGIGNYLGIYCVFFFVCFLDRVLETYETAFNLPFRNKFWFNYFKTQIILKANELDSKMLCLMTHFNRN